MLTALEELLQDDTAGDPIRGVKWTGKTPEKLSRAVRRQGLRVGRTTLRRVLQARGYAWRVKRKRLSRRQDPQRDRPMRSIARQRRRFRHAGGPVISVDTKKRELVGNCRNAGRTGRRPPLAVVATDFPSDAHGQAIPYGVSDLQRKRGYIALGTSPQTAELAVATLRTWWQQVGRRAYAGHEHLRSLADSGGANSCRSWGWKAGGQALADEFNLTLTVMPYPPGASKWNPLEHRRFRPISQNWAGQPLVNSETILKFIRTTKTRGGLRGRAYVDPTAYKTGRKLTTKEIAQIKVSPHRLLPSGNYTIKPRSEHVTNEQVIFG